MRTDYNPGYPVGRFNNNMGVLPLTPTGKNSTMFTECCHVAICDDEENCSYCKRKIIGWDAESKHERSMIRWRYATAAWNRWKG